MARRKPKSEVEKSIDEMANDLVRDTVKSMCKDGNLTPRPCPMPAASIAPSFVTSAQ